MLYLRFLNKSVSIISFVFIILLVSNVAHLEDMNTYGYLIADYSNTTSPLPNPIFSDRGYPNVGDLPLLNRKVYAAMHVTIQEHVYVASIRRNLSHYLTGVILTKNLYLSVAHALHEVPVYELAIVVGESYCDRGQTYLSVILVVIHKLFNPTTYEHDIALLRTFEDIVYSMFTKPINLASRSMDLNGAMGFVTGWGRCQINELNGEVCLPRSSAYYPDEDLDPLLMSARLQLYYPEPNCDTYQDNNTPIIKGMLCVGMSQKFYPYTPCFAVPGAPLIVNDVLLAGIASWGFACGYKDDMPIVYTDLRHYNFWITHNLYIINSIPQENFTELYIAHRAYVLRDTFLQSTPEYNPAFNYKRHIINYTELNLKPMAIDNTLARLRGNVYDLRDFMPGVRDKKNEMYKQIKTTEKIPDSLSSLYDTSEYSMYEINDNSAYYNNDPDYYEANPFG